MHFMQYKKLNKKNPKFLWELKRGLGMASNAQAPPHEEAKKQGKCHYPASVATIPKFNF